MSHLRGTGALTRAYLKRSFRSRTSLFWNFAFPLLWLFVFAFIFGDGDPRRVSYLMPGLFTITIVAISFAGVSYRMVGERERGTLRRYHVTPVRATAVVLANAVSSLVILAVSLFLLGTVAWAAFDIEVSAGVAELVLVLALGSLSLVPLGLVVGSVAPSTESAPAINNAIFFPLIFVTGAAIPFAMLPGWVQALGRALPPSYLVDALQGVMVRGAPTRSIAGALAVLAVTGIAGTAFSSLLFRWESDAPLDRSRTAAVGVGLVLLCLGLAWLGPHLEMTDPSDVPEIELLGGGFDGATPGPGAETGTSTAGRAGGPASGAG